MRDRQQSALRATIGHQPCWKLHVRRFIQKDSHVIAKNMKDTPKLLCSFTGHEKMMIICMEPYGFGAQIFPIFRAQIGPSCAVSSVSSARKPAIHRIIRIIQRSIGFWGEILRGIVGINHIPIGDIGDKPLSRPCKP